MDTKKEFQIFCHFNAIGEKRIMASSFEEATQIAEADNSVEFDKIIRLTEPCKVDISLSHVVNEPIPESPHDFEYKSWGSE